MTYAIDRYLGAWRNAEGYRLEVNAVDATHAVASLISPFGVPISRPYYDDRPTAHRCLPAMPRIALRAGAKCCGRACNAVDGWAGRG